MTATKHAKLQGGTTNGLDFRPSKPVKSNPGSGGTRDGASSFSQPLQALQLGNQKRFRLAAVKRAVKAKTLTLDEAFDNEATWDTGVARIMECVPYLTPEKVSTILLIAQVGYACPVGHLMPRDRWKIMYLLAQRHPGLKVKP